MSVNCINLANIDENLSCAEQDNMGGLVPRLIYGYWDDVDSWPDWPNPDGNNILSLEEAGTITDDIVMRSGTVAHVVNFSDDTGVFTIAPQGEKGGISFLYTLTFINKRIRKLILGFLNAARNRKMFFIVQDANGVYYLMGDKHRGAMLQASDGASTGTNTTDQNQVTTVFTYTCPRALSYEGDVDTILVGNVNSVTPSTP